MNVAVRKQITLAEFLAWEERHELRHEFDGLRVIAMAGGTAPIPLSTAISPPP